MQKIIYPILALLLSMASVALAGEKQQATFAVGCYDVGASALQNRPGVLHVDKGWQGFHEVNRVEYDPQLVNVKQLELWLKEAHTWSATLTERSKE